MIEKYSLYYAYKTIGDVLLVNIVPNGHPNNFKRIKDVVAIYDDKQLIGYNIFNISEIIKIKMVGILYHPENIFIDIVNSILKNAGLETLSYKEESGFVVGEVKETFDTAHGYMTMVNIKDRIVCGMANKEVFPNDKIVIAKVGTTLRDGSLVKEYTNECGIVDCHICSGKDVFYDESVRPLVLDNEIEIGIDFFKTEVK